MCAVTVQHNFDGVNVLHVRNTPPARRSKTTRCDFSKLVCLLIPDMTSTLLGPRMHVVAHVERISHFFSTFAPCFGTNHERLALRLKPKPGSARTLRIGVQKLNINSDMFRNISSIPQERICHNIVAHLNFPPASRHPHVPVATSDDESSSSARLPVLQPSLGGHWFTPYSTIDALSE
jgi:hypothetical protein